MNTKYTIDNLTYMDMQSLIANGKNDCDNQIRVTKNGQVYLSEGIVGAEEIEYLQFRLKTFDARSNSVGPSAANDKKWVIRLFNAVQINWNKRTKGSVDSF